MKTAWKRVCLIVLIFLGSSFGLVPWAEESVAKSLEDSFVNIADSVGKAVVTIIVEQTINARYGQEGMSGDPFLDEFLDHFFGGRPQQYKQKGLGSGFILNKEGYILTNDHVVGNADKIEVTLPDGRNFKATLLGSDKRADIALIKIEGKNLPFVKLGNSNNVKPGQWSLALGNPFGNIVNNPKPTITAGIISAIHRSINAREEDRMYGDLIQTDAPINQGNSGGPLVNIEGEVIGINTLIFSPSGGSVGIGFAIPINRAKLIADDIMSGKAIRHGWVGLWLQDLDMNMLRQFGLPEEKTGALVFKVEKGSPAETAGFESGDIILDIESQTVQNSSDVTRVISNHVPGDSIKCTVFRKGKELPLTITIGERKEKSSLKVSSKSSEEPTLTEWRGLTVQDITDDIAKELNLSSKDGVVVTKVAFGSGAFNAKLSPGDVIYSIAQTPVNNVADFRKVASQHKKGDVLVHTSRGYVVIFEEKQ